MNEIPGDGDGADKAREQIVRTTQRAAILQLALLVLAALAVVMSSATAVFIGLGNRNRQADTQKLTAAAIQTILRYIDDSIDPHRLRNEAENTCQVETFAGLPPYSDKGVEESLRFYTECVLRRSGNTAPPPLPPNPLTTTTTGG